MLHWHPLVVGSICDPLIATIYQRQIHKCSNRCGILLKNQQIDNKIAAANICQEKSVNANHKKWCEKCAMRSNATDKRNKFTRLTRAGGDCGD